MKEFIPHDLIWLGSRAEVTPEPPEWATEGLRRGDPLVIRRDRAPEGYVPAGVRGRTRGERFACFVPVDSIRRRLAPEEVIGLLGEWKGPELPPVRALRELSSRCWPFRWGPGGSCAFSLATGRSVMREGSDLDLILRAQEPIPREALELWVRATSDLPCRADTQIDTGRGGFSLADYLAHPKVLLKTSLGPVLTRDPWGKGNET